jgi:hypothetical protein
VREVLIKYSIYIEPVEKVETAWINQFKLANTNDLDNIYFQGFFRTRGIGRTNPTFHQARLFSIPIYPYLDKSIMESYQSVPTKYLKWGKVHLRQISRDKNFNFINTTRFPISAYKEEKFSGIMGYLRKLEVIKKERSKNKIIEKLDYNNAFDDAFKGFEQLPKQLTDDLTKWKMKTSGYYQTLSNLLAALRIEKSYFNKKGKNRSNIQILKYVLKHEG